MAAQPTCTLLPRVSDSVQYVLSGLARLPAGSSSGSSSSWVRAASEGADQSLSPSPFCACTRTWYSVSAVSPVTIVVTAAPSCEKSSRPTPAPSRYCTS